MLEFGLDVQTLVADSHIVLMRPQRLAPMSDLVTQAMNLEVVEPAVQRLFSGGEHAASEFFHEPQKASIDSFATLGPPFARTKTNLESYFARAGLAARRPFARSLAMHDDRLIFDGGDAVPMGQETAVQSFFQTYRQLPDRSFQTLTLKDAAPLVVRVSSDQNETYVYAVNTSPWIAQANIQWAAPKDCVVIRLGANDVAVGELFGQTDVDLSVEPYGLVAFKFGSPDVKMLRCRTQLPSNTAKQLKIQLDEIVSRVNQIGQHRLHTELLRDPGFETPITNDSSSSWTFRRSPDGLVAIDRDVRASGNSSLRLQAKTGPVSVTSHEFIVPETGRLVLSMKVRSSRPSSSPVQIHLQSSDPGYEKRFRLKNLTTEFQQVRIPITDLPLDPEVRYRLSIEMVSAGEVWVDDIQHSWFVPDDKGALLKILHYAGYQHDKGDLATCYETLSGYWPRFLLRHVPPVELATRPTRPRQQETSTKKSKKSGFLDKWRRLVPRFR
jgi:hypothetical protein